MYKFYDILGVAKDASDIDIKKAYKRAAMQHHPDKGGDPEKFKEVSQAYEVLSDKESREKYNHLGDSRWNEVNQQGGGGGGFNPFEDMFASMFSNSRPGPRKANDKIHKIKITLKEAYEGIVKTFKISLQRDCKACMKTCDACQGQGIIRRMIQNGFMTQVITQPCGVCNSSGKIQRNGGCSECKHKGFIVDNKTVNVGIPRGANNGHQFMIEGLGEQNADIPGNLIIVLTIEPDSALLREGNNLVYNVNISYIESILGKEITIPFFDRNIVYYLAGPIHPGGHRHPDCELGIGSGGYLEINCIISYPDPEKIKYTSEQIDYLRSIFIC